MQSDLWGHRPAAGAAAAERTDLAAAEAGVTALYQAHALGLMRLAHIMLGDRPSAEDVVQEAFCGLYRRWSHLSDTGRALQYLRASVLNGCRSLQRRRAGPRTQPDDGQPAVSAEAAVITGEERREVMLALHANPGPGPRGPAIEVFTLATGAHRVWAWPGTGWIGNFKPIGQALSWSADGRTLAFQQWGGKYDSTAHVRLLDTTAPGHDLRSSKLIATFLNKEGVLTIDLGNTLITPDGTKVVVPTMTQTRSGKTSTSRLEISEFSTHTGKIVRTLDRFRFFQPGPYQDVLWTDATGGTLIVSDPRGKSHASVIGVMSGHGFTPLPGAPQGIQIAW